MSSGYLPVTYPEFLAHPDDPEINIRWARTQIDRGDFGVQVLGGGKRPIVLKLCRPR